MIHTSSGYPFIRKVVRTVWPTHQGAKPPTMKPTYDTAVRDAIRKRMLTKKYKEIAGS